MALDPNIILRGQPVNALGAMAGGLQLADAHNQIRQDNALRSLYQQHGAGIAQGDPTAINALAAGGFPAEALNVQQTHQGMAATDLGMENTRLGMEATRQGMQHADERLELARQEAARLAASEAAKLTAAEREAQAERTKNAIIGASAAQTPEQWDRFVTENGVPQLAGRFADRDMILAQAQGSLDGLTGSGANVQRGEPLPDGSGFVTLMSDGTALVTTAGGDRLTGQAAQDFVTAAQDNYTQSQRSIYGARREGTLGADIELGGTAAASEKAGEQAIDMSGDAWTSYAKIQTSLSNIDEALAALDRGGETGAVLKYLPNVTEASASLQNAMDSMGLDVVGAVTFGALSEGELRLAMNVAVPRDLGPQELKVWLERKRDAQANTAAMLADAAQFLGQPDTTLADWIARNRNSDNNVEVRRLSPEEAANMTDEELFEHYGIGGN